MKPHNQYGIPFLLIFCGLVHSQGLPSVTESYTAIGEIVGTVEIFENITIQLIFEENYDYEGQRASFDITQIGNKASFVEFLDEQQTFQYKEGGCKVFTPEEWVSIGSPPDIRPYETSNGNVVFPLRQLINLTSSTLRNPEANTNSFYRSVPAKLYQHRITFDFADTNTTLDIDAYWSDGDWNTSSKNNVVPLGFVVNRATYNKTAQETHKEYQYINIFYFVHGAVDLNAFRVREGVLCDGIKQTLPFPNAETLTVFSYSTEFMTSGYESISAVDTWWDSKNRILRFDYDPLRRPDPTSKIQYSVSDIISHNQGAVYRITDGGDKCELMDLSSYEFDPQYLIDVRSEGVWIRPVTTFFGLEETDMIYIGKTVKRGIPCSLWQGERIDWPSIYRPTTTIWEWCIANEKTKQVEYEEDDFPLVNLEITIKESSSKTSPLQAGSKMTYGLYNVKIQSPSVMEAMAFDLYPCFLNNHMKLMFLVNYNNSLEEALNRTVSNPDLVAIWRTAVKHAAKFPVTSLRISQLRMVLYGNKLVVKFTLLGVHKSLQAAVKNNEVSLISARRNLEDAINKGKVAAKLTMAGSKGNLSMKAVPDSLTEEESTLVDPSSSSTVSSKTDETTMTSKYSTRNEDVETTTKFSTKLDEHSTSTHIVPVNSDTNTFPTDSTLTPTASTSTPTDSTPTDSTPTDSTPTDSTPTATPLQQKSDVKRYSSGIMALVGLIMLFVGTGIGASGTYYKIKKM